MSDWATDEAVEILDRCLAFDRPSYFELGAWLAIKLRLIHQHGVGEGIERLSKALTPEQASQ